MLDKGAIVLPQAGILPADAAQGLVPQLALHLTQPVAAQQRAAAVHHGNHPVAVAVHPGGLPQTLAQLALHGGIARCRLLVHHHVPARAAGVRAVARGADKLLIIYRIPVQHVHHAPCCRRLYHSGPAGASRGTRPARLFLAEIIDKR